MWIEPKTDWNNDDFLEAADMNRVEGNTQELANLLRGLQYNVPELTVVTNRDTSSIDLISNINRIENNIEALRDRFVTPEGYQDAKTWSVGAGFTYLDAIRLENNLKLLHWAFQAAKKNLRYCGTFACGEEGVIY